MEINISISFILFFFIFWFIVGIVYSLRPELLGKVGGFLHRYGWLRQWAMYTKQLNSKIHQKVFIADVNDTNEEVFWSELECQFQSPSKVIYNPEFGWGFFISKCLRKITAKYRNGKGSELNVAVFNYMCSVLAEYPNPNKKKYRKVKVVRIEEDLIEKELILSEYILIK